MSCGCTNQSATLAANAACCQPTRTPSCYPQDNPFATFPPGADLTPPNPVTPWDSTNPPATLLPPVPAFAAGLYSAYLAAHPA